MRVDSVTSQGTPPRNILQEKTGFLCLLGGKVPDHVQLTSTEVASYCLTDSRLSWGAEDVCKEVSKFGDAGDRLVDNEGKEGEM